MNEAHLWLGTQGWNYPGWLGSFYPSTTRAADFLTVYARAFDTVEVDATFYAIPPSSTVKGWVKRTPEKFRFALKLPREITHERRFVKSEDILNEFLDRARELDNRLGPILIQCGPDFSPLEVSALEGFLALLPADIKFAIEFRQKGWITAGNLDLLKSRNVAIALSDGRWIPRDTLLRLCRNPTSNFSYVRWMGPDRSITDFSRIQIDRTVESDAWAAGIAELQRGVEDIFAFANNHFAGHAPATVRMVQERLGLPVVDPQEISEQRSLF